MISEDEMSELWERIRRFRAVGENWERVDQAVSFIQIADQVRYVGKKRKVENEN